MRDIKNKVIAGVLSMAMMITGLPGMGALVVNATENDDVAATLMSADISSVSVPESIDASETSTTVVVSGTELPSNLYIKRQFTVVGDDLLNTVDWTWVLVNTTGTDTERTFTLDLPQQSKPVGKWIVQIGTDQFGDGVIKKTSIEVTGGEEVEIPQVESVQVSPSEVSADGQEVTVTVRGTALPDNGYYKIFCNADDGFNGYYDYSIGYSGTQVAMSGSSSEKTFQVSIPAVASLDKNDVQGFKVAVGIAGAYAGDFVKSGMVTVKASETPSEPVAKTEIKEIKLSASTYIYDGKVKTPMVTVIDENGNTVDPADLAIAIEVAKKPGTYDVTAYGENDYTGELHKTFSIKVKTTYVKSLKRGKKSFTVKVAKRLSKNVTGYQVRYSLKSTMKSSKTVTIGKKYSTVSKTVKKLKAGKKYYVQVRAYKTVSGKKYYSAWSAKKSVKTK